MLAATLVLQPVGAYAATITTSNLAEIPIQGLNPVKPNIMYTMDDSGSMALATLPDYVNNQLFPTYSGAPYLGPFAPGDDRYSNSWCLGNTGASVLCALTSPPLASSQVNHIYYDPAIQYMKGKNSDGTDLSCEGSNMLCDGPWSAVYSDGFAGYPNANSGGRSIS